MGSLYFIQYIHLINENYFYLFSTPEEKESQGEGDNKDESIEDDDVGQIRSSSHDVTILAGPDDHVLEVGLATKVEKK